MDNLVTIGNVRGYEDENGTVWLSAEDVARGFGFVRYQGGVEYVRWERVNSYLEEFGFYPQVGKMDFIPENMVYRLGFKASNSAAHRFQAKLADEVIPSIRKNGGYIAGQEDLTDDELMAKALMVADRKIKERDRRIRELTDETQKLSTENEVMKPKARFADAVSMKPDIILIGDLAKILKQNGVDTGQNRLFDTLRNEGYLVKSSSTGYNMPTQRAMELGLFRIVERLVENRGEQRLTKTVYVTNKGQQYFINRYTR